jgi:hypothetical protein
MTTSKMISQNVGGVTDDCRIIVGRVHPFLLVVVVVGRSKGLLEGIRFMFTQSHRSKKSSKEGAHNAIGSKKNEDGKP